MEDTILAIAAQELGLGPGELDADLNLRDLPGAESVRLLRIVAAVETEYGVELDDEVVFGQVQSVRDLAEAVRSLLPGTKRTG